MKKPDKQRKKRSKARSHPPTPSSASLNAEPWERQPGESDPAWEAFIVFRDMGSARSLPPVARRLSKSVALMKRWSARWSWRERVRQWNIHIDREVNEASVEILRETRSRHLRLAQMMLAKYLERIGGITAQDIPVTMLDRLLKVGTETELLAIGAASEVSEVNSKVSLDVADDEALIAKLRKIAGADL